MSDLCISPVFKEITSMVGVQSFSSMYFGRHCGKNILVLHHEITLMLVFKNNDQSVPQQDLSRPDFVKSVSSKGVAIKGVEIIGNEDVLLLLDDTGKLWRLINAFEFSDERDERLYLLDEKCFYEWVPFKKFNFTEVLAISAWGRGFACLGTCANSEKKLVWFPFASPNTAKDCTFQEVRSSSSSHFHVINVSVNSEDSCSAASAGESLLITDRSTGKTYLCSDGGRIDFVNYSNNFLVSVVHFKQENCLLLGFNSGKLVFTFLNTSQSDCALYLPKSLSLMQECCCSASCLLWSDGLLLYHTKFTFEPRVKPFHLKLHGNIEKPSHIIRFGKDILAVTVNNIYYRIRAGSDAAVKVERKPDEVLSEICEGSLKVHDLNMKIDNVSHFLQCKEIMDGSDVREKVEMSLEQNHLVIKFRMNVSLKKEFWKVKLTTFYSDKNHVKMADLETDVSEGMPIRVENPFVKKRSKVRVALVGEFEGEGLFVDLGEVGESGELGEWEGSDLSSHLKQILIRKNPFYAKEKSAFNFG